MNKLKVGIYLENKGISDVYISDLSYGNCGIGGTRYEILYFIQNIIGKSNENGIELIVFTTKKQASFMDYGEVIVADVRDVFKKCNEMSVDIIVLRGVDGINHTDDLNNTKIIYWLHNFITFQDANKIAQNPKISCCVFVSKQMYDFYIEHDICKKGVVIYNAIPSKIGPIKTNYLNRKKDVAYVGNIGLWKGFHNVLTVWEKVVKKNPDSKLFVIGNAASNNRRVEMGPMGIGTPQYEQQLIEFLKKRKIENTVSFLGILGVEKNDILSNCKVGIIPSKRETFCLAAIDFVQNGTPVVALKTTGLLETVNDGHTGLLVNKVNNMKKAILRLLNNEVELDFETEYLVKFSPSVIYKQWIELFYDIYQNDIFKTEPLPASKPYGDCYKFVGIQLRKLRKVFKLSNRFSRIGVRDLIYKVFKK